MHTVSDNLLTTQKVATLLGISEATLRFWRHKGKGPAFVRVGRVVRYKRKEIERWIVSRSVCHETGEPLNKFLAECERAARHCEKDAPHLSHDDLGTLFVAHVKLAFDKFIEATKPDEDIAECRNGTASMLKS